jgi:hypothetical protein
MMLRERLFLLVQQQSGTEATLLLPQELGKNNFLSTKQGGLQRVLPQSLIFLQPRLSSWTENMPTTSCTQRKLVFQFSSEPESCTRSPSFGKWSLDSSSSQSPLPMNSLLFFPSSARLCGSESPVRGQVRKSFRWVLFPSPH